MSAPSVVIVVMPSVPEIQVNYYRAVPVAVVERIVTPVVCTAIVRIVSPPAISIIIIIYRVASGVSDTKSTTSINTYSPGKWLVVIPV
jgi:hypothetical protein